ncbi:MAG: hypothetical protein ACRDHG_03045, partial [Anaerolineales bacterium]
LWAILPYFESKIAMPTWTEATQEHYYEMLEILPPAIMTGLGFLVGEPFDHNGAGQPREIGGKFYEATEVLTVAEFRRITPAMVA